MTLTWLEVFSVLVGPLLLGAMLLRWQGVVPRTDPLAYFGWAWLQGCLGLALLLSAWLWLRWPLAATHVAPVLLGLSVFGFALARRVRVMEPPAPGRHPAWERWVFALVLALLLATTLDRILLASADILVSSDETRIWAAKARVLFHTGGFDEGFLAAVRTPEIIAHPDYPPLNPLLQLWVHAHAGTLVHVESRLPVQFYGLAGILVAASALRRRARPLVAALFLICIATIGRFFTYQVFSDALIAIGLLACWDLWQRYQEDGGAEEGGAGWLRLLGCTAPMLVWSKNEGTLHVLVFGLALGLGVLTRRVRLPTGRARWRALARVVPLVASMLYLGWFNRHFGLVNDLLQGSAEPPDVGLGGRAPGFAGLAFQHAAENVRPILIRFATLIGEVAQTRGLLLAFLVLLVVTPRKACGGGRFVFTLGLLLALFGYMAVYLGTHWDVDVHLKHSAHRLVYHLTLAAGLWLLLYVVEALPHLRERPPDEPPDDTLR